MEISKIHGNFIVSIFKLSNQTRAIADSEGRRKGFEVEIHSKLHYYKKFNP